MKELRLVVWTAVVFAVLRCVTLPVAVGGESLTSSVGPGGMRRLSATVEVLKECEERHRAVCGGDEDSAEEEQGARVGECAEFSECFFDEYQATFRGWPPVHAPPQQIDTIAIVGERASGTFFVQKMMKQNFAQSVQHKLTRHKHWFQQEAPAESLDRTLVVVVFRNAWDWSESLYRHPWHAPEHFGIDFTDFLKTPWTIPAFKLPQRPPFEPGRKCQNGFESGQVVPCQQADLGSYTYARGDFMSQRNPDEYPAQYGGKEPIYEMDPNQAPGTPFASPLALRAAKIQSFLNISKWAPHVAFVRYEDMLASDTAELLIAGLRAHYPALVPRTHSPQVAVEHYKGFSRHRPTQTFKFNAKTLFYLYPDDPVASPKTARLKEPFAYCLINETLDHDVEAAVGYVTQPQLNPSPNCTTLPLPTIKAPRSPPLTHKKKKKKKNARTFSDEL